MIIWIIDHYSVPVKYYPLARNTNFAKYMMRMGHEVMIFAASTVHNSDVNLIEADSKYKEVIDDEVKYVLVKCHQYTGNGVKRILNMMEFAWNLENICDKYQKPDAIISTSMTLHACKKGIQLGKKYCCKRIAQITDLWPETLIAYGLASKKHPLVCWFRKMEKWIYTNADQIVFSMEGAYDYIVEQRWESLIPREKVHFINNGVDLEQYNYNKEHYKIEDEDLNNPDIFKVIYTGSIREVNNIGKLIDVAKMIRNPKVKFLIWGDGSQKDALQELIKKEKIANFVFKGKVDKKYIPYITSKADLNIAHNTSSPLFRFGISFNKIFDYMAAGKPILCDFQCRYNPVVSENAGIAVESGDEEEISRAIDKLSSQIGNDELCSNALRAITQKYSFEKLTETLVSVVEMA